MSATGPALAPAATAVTCLLTGALIAATHLQCASTWALFVGLLLSSPWLRALLPSLLGAPA